MFMDLKCPLIFRLGIVIGYYLGKNNKKKKKPYHL